MARPHLLWLAAPALLALAACGTDAADSGASTDPDTTLDGGTGGGDATGDAGTDGNPTLDVGGPDADEDGGATDGGGGSDGGETDGGGSGGPLPGGSDCADDADCPFGTFCDTRYGQPFYCAPAPGPDGNACDTDADCDLEDSDDVFCCTAVGQGRTCTRAGSPSEGATCGDRSGEQGDSCVDGGQSDCADDAYCVFAARDFAYCGDFCVPSADGCPDGSYCYSTAPGFGICLETGDTEDYASCADDPTSCGEGRFCVEGVTDDPLAYCTAGCEIDADCDEGDACTDFGACEPAGDLEVGASCAEDRFACAEGLICLNYGTRVAACTEVCERDRDCTEDTFCNFFEPGRGVCQRRGDRPNGAFCGDDPSACEGVCSGAYDRYEAGAFCIDECEGDRDCPDNGRCVDFPGGRAYCQPDGELTQGGDCGGDAFDCATNHVCLNYGTSFAFCSQYCTDSSDCPADTWCSGNDGAQGVCLPDGDIAPGESCSTAEFECAPGSFCAGEPDPLCFVRCDEAGTECPSGQVCRDFGEASWCYPEGDRGYGEGCSDDIWSCSEGLFCADAASGSGRCSRGCRADDECEGDDWCFVSRDGGYCRPAGDVERGDACADDVYACEAGLACLFGGTAGAFCSAECTGFADSCEGDEACRFVGYGRTFCVPSGDGGHGDSCADDRFACSDDAWCVNAGTDEAVCVQTCSFDPDACPDGTSCRFLASGLGVCLRAGLSPEDPLNPGGAPF